MTTAELKQVDEVFRVVLSWPRPNQLTLARRVLDHLDQAAELDEKPPHKIPLARIFGMLKTDAPPPDDATCKRWIEEERLKKYE